MNMSTDSVCYLFLNLDSIKNTIAHHTEISIDFYQLTPGKISGEHLNRKKCFHNVGIRAIIPCVKCTRNSSEFLLIPGACLLANTNFDSGSIYLQFLILFP